MSRENDHPSRNASDSGRSGRARLLPSQPTSTGAVPREAPPTEATPAARQEPRPTGACRPSDSELPNRRKPAEGVRIELGRPNIVFVTVCTKDRGAWLACEEAQRLLVQVWRQADTWQTGRYVLMPDHVHLFAAPRDLRFTIERWLQYWKSQFSKAHNHADWVWQSKAFHHRLRHDESYSEKWRYERENPLRAGLVTDVERRSCCDGCQGRPRRHIALDLARFLVPRPPQVVIGLQSRPQLR